MRFFSESENGPICVLMRPCPYSAQEANRNTKTSKAEQLSKSALYRHQTNENHKINWDDWKIISKDGKKYQLMIRESLHILNKQPGLNRTTCSVPLIVYPEGLQTRHKVRLKLVPFDTSHRGDIS